MMTQILNLFYRITDNPEYYGSLLLIFLAVGLIVIGVTS